MSVIELKKINKEFEMATGSSLWNPFAKKQVQKIEALKDINFRIQKGEFVALLGPNGAGKSTLIKILIGVMMPSFGEVKVFGFDPLENRQQIISKLGIVFGQRSRLQYDLPVSESLELTKRLYIDGYPKSLNREDQEWFDYLIDSINIRELLDRPVKKLSLGQKMRCELVNTLLYNPDLIFLDEPTIGLDIVSKLQIREALKKLNEMGKTIILTSHDTGDIVDLCQRVMIINHGGLVVDTSISEFNKLNDTKTLKVKMSKEIDVAEAKIWLKGLDLKVLKLQSEIVEVQVSNTKATEILKQFLEKFEIADVEIGAEPVEEILRSIYNR